MPEIDEMRRQHLLFAWWSLLFFLALGISLEAMHGLKIGWYLDVANEARRLTWTLAHSHGTLLALVNAAFAYSLGALSIAPTTACRLASRSLMGATVLLPSGFFLGGIGIYSGDPGLGIFLVPLGAGLLFASVALTAWVVTRS